MMQGLRVRGRVCAVSTVLTGRLWRGLCVERKSGPILSSSAPSHEVDTRHQAEQPRRARQGDWASGQSERAQMIKHGGSEQLSRDQQHEEHGGAGNGCDGKSTEDDQRTGKACEQYPGRRRGEGHRSQAHAPEQREQGHDAGQADEDGECCGQERCAKHSRDRCVDRGLRGKHDANR